MRSPDSEFILSCVCSDLRCSEILVSYAWLTNNSLTDYRYSCHKTQCFLTSLIFFNSLETSLISLSLTHQNFHLYVPFLRPPENRFGIVVAFLSHQCKRLDKTSNCVTLLHYFYTISIPLACNCSNTARYICERFRTQSKIIKSYKIPCFLFLLNHLLKISPHFMQPDYCRISSRHSMNGSYYDRLESTSQNFCAFL